MTLRVKEICKEKGLQMQELADKLGITRITLTRNISGNPTISTLESIATALNVDITELFAKRGDFIAFVRDHGETHTFDTPMALIEYADGLKGKMGPEAPATSTAPVQASIYDDPIFR